jgi:hypothetical protein
LQVQVAELSNGNVVLTDAGTTISEGGAFAVVEQGDYSDGYLNPSEYVDVPFTICLRSRKRFKFFVDVLGVADATQVASEDFDGDPGWTTFNLPGDSKDFGFKNSNFAGGNLGEAGGLFSGSGQRSWYADDSIGDVTASREIRASGLLNIVNVEPGYDNNVVIGHFDSRAAPDERAGRIGFQILENRSTSPFSFRVFYKIGDGEGYLFVVDGINERRTWSYLYDPDDGPHGSLTVSISGSGGNTATIFLSESQRSSIGAPNAFGLLNVCCTGGNMGEQLEAYIDDVTYTVN